MNTRPLDTDLFDLCCGAIETALEYVRLAETGRTYVGNHERWPELRWQENGLPYISTAYPGPKNYGDAIRASLFHIGFTEPAPDFVKEPKFLALVEYAKLQPRLKQYLGYDQEEHDFGTSHLSGIVEDMLDRYIHINKLETFDREKLLPVYLPMERHLLEESLPITIVVPILFLKFEFEQFEINESLRIEKMSDELLLARGWSGPFGNTDNTLTESAATHALFISGLAIQNETWIQRMVTGSDSYSVEDIDTFFGALRVSLGHKTGYAQILAIREGWTSSYMADLMPIDRHSVEKFPNKGYWNEELPAVKLEEAEELRDAFQNLQEIFATKHSRKVHLAIDRLNLSSLRSSDVDRVIDTMIALEALLSDDTQEMTHKIALRLGALYKVLDPSRSETSFAELKRIYAFRSKIVHGSDNYENHRIIKRGAVEIPAVDAAAEHLRNAFVTLIKNPHFLVPANIDRFLLTDKIPE